MITNINDLSVELFHTIFDYLSAYEMIRAFHDLNDYLDGVLKSYPNFKLDFQSIQKSRFDLICQYVQPSSIKSLRLSDYLNETAGQSELFVSRINVEQMKNLEVLSLTQIEDAPLATIFNVLSTFKHLSSLTLMKWEPPNLDNYRLGIGFEDTYLAMYEIILKTDTYFLAQFIDILLPRRQHLTLRACNIAQFTCICHHPMASTSLRSLDIVITVDVQDDAEFFPSFDNTAVYLTRLKLKLDYNNRSEQRCHKIARSAIERFLRQTPNLIHLDLSASVRQEFADGTYWSHFICTYLPRLCSFDFYFNFHDSNFDEDDFNTFRSSFWLEFKRWYVAWDGIYHLYTLTNRYFHDIDINFDVRTTCSEGLALLCKTVTYLRGSRINLPLTSLESNRFSNVHTLDMEFGTWPYSPHLDSPVTGFYNVLQYATVRHVIFSREISWNALLGCYQPNLSELTLHSLCQCKRYFPLYSIRRLHILAVDNIDQICSIFPSLEHLKISVSDQNEIVYILNRLKYLCTTEFYYNTNNRISIEWICKKTNLTKDNFTYRINEQSCILYMWINNQSKKNVLCSNTFTRCYLWLKRKKSRKTTYEPCRWKSFLTLYECPFKVGLFATTPLKDEALLPTHAAHRRF